MILYNGKSRLDGAPLVAIATGYKRRSRNRKTGPMVQVWILRSDIEPHLAARDGRADYAICGNCPLRAAPGRKRRCYVRLEDAPLSVYRKFKAGGYEEATSPKALQLFGYGESIRLGAYGDPAAVPASVWRNLLHYAANWTGYTHQWADPRAAALKAWCMASVDTVAERDTAWADGWRTFRTRAASLPLAGDVSCPASREAGHKSSCFKCGLCSGRTSKATRSVSIIRHGPWR